MMNKVFNLSVKLDKLWFRMQSDRLLSNTGAQATMYNDLLVQE